jgi:hypothetical protein
MRRLTALAIAVGVISTLSYGTGAHIAVRYLNPPFGAWWNANEFTMLECAAAAFGMIVGIRLGARLVSGLSLKNNSMIAAVIAGALGLPIVARTCAEVARYRFTHGASANAFLIDRYGYDTGMFLDKLLGAGVYSMKIVLIALPVGMILFGLAIVILMSAAPDPDSEHVISTRTTE